MKIYLDKKENYVFEHIKSVISYVFQTLLILFLFTLLAQQFYPNQISSRININYFMYVVIFFGIISILFPPRKDIFHIEKPPKIKDYLLIIILSILGAVIIFLKLKSLKIIGYIISILGGLIILLLSYLILTDNED